MNLTMPELLRALGWFLAVSWLFFLFRVVRNLAHAGPGERLKMGMGYAMGLLLLGLASAFVGTVLVTLGLGVFIPSILSIGMPLACPDGQPGFSGAFFCTLASGAQRDVSDAVLGHAALIYSVLLLTLVVWMGKLGLRITRLGPSRRVGD